MRPVHLKNQAILIPWAEVGAAEGGYHGHTSGTQGIHPHTVFGRVNDSLNLLTQITHQRRAQLTLENGPLYADPIGFEQPRQLGSAAGALAGRGYII